MSIVSDEAMRAAIEHARQDYPRESVGYVNGDGVYVPMSNISTEPERSFEVPNEESVQAQVSGIKALIHSHTQGAHSARPSGDDVACQTENPDVPWCIIVLGPHETQKGQHRLFESFWFGECLPPEPYIGRSYRYNVTDCYTIVRDWYKAELGIILPRFSSDYGWWETPGKSMFLDHFKEAGMSVVSGEPQYGDMIFMSFNTGHKRLVPNHIGVLLDKGLMLHHMQSRLSKTDPVNRYKHHIVNFMRHKDVKPRG